MWYSILTVQSTTRTSCGSGLEEGHLSIDAEQKEDGQRADTKEEEDKQGADTEEEEDKQWANTKEEEDKQRVVAERLADTKEGAIKLMIGSKV